MIALNKKGVTLVELVVGTLLLAIASTTLLMGYTGCANVINRAILLKNISSTAASSIELKEVQATPSNEDYTIDINQYDSSAFSDSLTIQAKKTNSTGTVKDFNFTVSGNYIIASEDEYTSLKYREFLPNNFSFDINAELVDED